jgi:hypothetical protein
MRGLGMTELSNDCPNGLHRSGRLRSEPVMPSPCKQYQLLSPYCFATFFLRAPQGTETAGKGGRMIWNKTKLDALKDKYGQSQGGEIASGDVVRAPRNMTPQPPPMQALRCCSRSSA